MATRTGWEIYYGDLSVYTAASGTWADAPSSGVQFVCECYDDGHRLVHMGMDYYYMDTMPSGVIGDYLEADAGDYTSLPASGVKAGAWVDHDAWHTIHESVFGE
jgi:hypothetical protein